MKISKLFHSKDAFLKDEKPYVRMKKNKLRMVINLTNEQLNLITHKVKLIKQLKERLWLEHQKSKNAQISEDNNEIDSLKQLLKDEEAMYAKEEALVVENQSQLQIIRARKLKSINKCSRMKVKLQLNDFKKFVLNRNKTKISKQRSSIPFIKNMRRGTCNNKMSNLWVTTATSRLNQSLPQCKTIELKRGSYSSRL